MQRPFVALAAQLGHRSFGGDAKDACAHSPPPERAAFVQINEDARAEWHEQKFGTKADRNLVLPAQHALQEGHPESGGLWEEHIDKIPSDPCLDFKSMTCCECICHAIFEGHAELLPHQVDNFLISCRHDMLVHNQTEPPHSSALGLPKITMVLTSLKHNSVLKSAVLDVLTKLLKHRDGMNPHKSK